MFKKTNTWRN